MAKTQWTECVLITKAPLDGSANCHPYVTRIGSFHERKLLPKPQSCDFNEYEYGGLCCVWRWPDLPALSAALLRCTGCTGPRAPASRRPSRSLPPASCPTRRCRRPPPTPPPPPPPPPPAEPSRGSRSEPPETPVATPPDPALHSHWLCPTPHSHVPPPSLSPVGAGLRLFFYTLRPSRVAPHVLCPVL